MMVLFFFFCCCAGLNCLFCALEDGKCDEDDGDGDVLVAGTTGLAAADVWL